MDRLLGTFLLDRGLQLRNNYSVTNKDIENLYEKLEPIINGIIYSKGKFINKLIIEEKNHKKHLDFVFQSKDLHPLQLTKDLTLNEPKLNIEYRIMYYVNDKNQIILLNYEPT